jgi:hypothetical protein
MPFNNWRLAVRALSEATGSITGRQKQMARLAKVTISPTAPAIVAAARLRLAFSEDLHLGTSLQSNDDAIELINHLWKGVKQGRPPSPNTQDEASAWIEYLFLVKRRKNLLALRPNEGDVVATRHGALAEISSIGENGRLYFKGGGGFGAWPDQVSMVAHARDTSDRAAKVRAKAKNEASLKRTAGDWSMVRHQDLLQFHVTRGVTPSEVLELESIIDTARDEKPIQQYLEANPGLLGSVLQRNLRYVIPRKRLGSEFVPDFIIGDVDSLGIHWYLVELESPQAPMYLKDRKTLSAQTRTGVDQVIHWRNWLQQNIAYARQPRAESGLGLFDIRPDTRALVLVGRGSTLNAITEAARHELRASSNIHVHTYDWLLESIRGAIAFSGPSALNPYALKRDDSSGEVNHG